MNKTIATVIAVALLAGCGIGGMKYYQDKKVEHLREDVVAELQDSVNLDDYRDAEREQVKGILDAASSEIQKEDNKAAMEVHVNDASTQIAELKTDDQYKKEEAAAEEQAELDREIQESEERTAEYRQRSEEARAQANAAKKKASSASSKKKKSSGNNGCVDDSADAYY